MKFYEGPLKKASKSQLLQDLVFYFIIKVIIIKVILSKSFGTEISGMTGKIVTGSGAYVPPSTGSFYFFKMGNG